MWTQNGMKITQSFSWQCRYASTCKCPKVVPALTVQQTPKSWQPRSRCSANPQYTIYQLLIHPWPLPKGGGHHTQIQKSSPMSPECSIHFPKYVKHELMLRMFLCCFCFIFKPKASINSQMLHLAQTTQPVSVAFFNSFFATWHQLQASSKAAWTHHMHCTQTLIPPPINGGDSTCQQHLAALVHIPL